VGMYSFTNSEARDKLSSVRDQWIKWSKGLPNDVPDHVLRLRVDESNLEKRSMGQS
jgi:hypothetical protein